MERASLGKHVDLLSRVGKGFDAPHSYVMNVLNHHGLLVGSGYLAILVTYVQLVKVTIDGSYRKLSYRPESFIATDLELNLHYVALSRTTVEGLVLCIDGNALNSASHPA